MRANGILLALHLSGAAAWTAGGAAVKPAGESIPGDVAVGALTLEAALRMAAERDPEVLAVLADVEAAASERREARLPPGPEAEASYRFGDREDKTGIAVTADLSHLLLYPMKWGLAGARHHEARRRAAISLADRELEVKTAFLSLQAAQQAETLFGGMREAAEASAELAALQRKAGNINALEEDVQVAQRQDAVLGHARARKETASARQDLALLIGMPASADSLRAADTLPPIPPSDPALADLLAAAFGKGPELEAAKAAEAAADKALWLARIDRLPLRAGVEWEREGGRDFLGPKAEVRIPLDLGWNAASKARWERTAARHRVASAEAVTRARIAALRARMAAAREEGEYLERNVSPHRIAVLEEMQKHYNFMLEGVYELILARQRVYAGQREALEARKEYWVARAGLERALGAPLPRPAPPEAPPPGAGSAPEPAPASPAPSGHDHDGGR